MRFSKIATLAALSLCSTKLQNCSRNSILMSNITQFDLVQELNKGKCSQRECDKIVQFICDSLDSGSYADIYDFLEVFICVYFSGDLAIFESSSKNGFRGMEPNALKDIVVSRRMSSWIQKFPSCKCFLANNVSPFEAKVSVKFQDVRSKKTKDNAKIQCLIDLFDLTKAGASHRVRGQVLSNVIPDFILGDYGHKKTFDVPLDIFPAAFKEILNQRGGDSLSADIRCEPLLSNSNRAAANGGGFASWINKDVEYVENNSARLASTKAYIQLYFNEFFFVHFAAYPLKCLNYNSHYAKNIYYSLLSKYLACFFPVDAEHEHQLFDVTQRNLFLRVLVQLWMCENNTCEATEEGSRGWNASVNTPYNRGMNTRQIGRTSSDSVDSNEYVAFKLSASVQRAIHITIKHLQREVLGRHIYGDEVLDRNAQMAGLQPGMWDIHVFVYRFFERGIGSLNSEAIDLMLLPNESNASDTSKNSLSGVSQRIMKKVSSIFDAFRKVTSLWVVYLKPWTTTANSGSNGGFDLETHGAYLAKNYSFYCNLYGKFLEGVRDVLSLDGHSGRAFDVLLLKLGLEMNTVLDVFKGSGEIIEFMEFLTRYLKRSNSSAVSADMWVQSLDTLGFRVPATWNAERVVALLNITENSVFALLDEGINVLPSSSTSLSGNINMIQQIIKSFDKIVWRLQRDSMTNEQRDLKGKVEECVKLAQGIYRCDPTLALTDYKGNQVIGYQRYDPRLHFARGRDISTESTVPITDSEIHMLASILSTLECFLKRTVYVTPPLRWLGYYWVWNVVLAGTVYKHPSTWMCVVLGMMLLAQYRLYILRSLNGIQIIPESFLQWKPVKKQSNSRSKGKLFNPFDLSCLITITIVSLLLNILALSSGSSSIPPSTHIWVALFIMLIYYLFGQYALV